MINFRKFMEEIGETQSSPVVSQQSWGYRALQNWYEFNRGKWSEVEQAAQRNPKLGQFLASVRQQYETQKTPNPKFKYGGIDFNTMGHIGDVIQRATSKVFPDHTRNQQPKFSPLRPGEREQPNQAPPSASYSPTTDYTTPGQISNKNMDVTTVIPMLQRLEDRVRSLEAKLGIKNGSGVVA